MQKGCFNCSTYKQEQKVQTQEQGGGGACYTQTLTKICKMADKKTWKKFMFLTYVELCVFFHIHSYRFLQNTLPILIAPLCYHVKSYERFVKYIHQRICLQNSERNCVLISSKHILVIGYSDGGFHGLPQYLQISGTFTQAIIPFQILTFYLI
jgi:hypothetical protein